MGFQRVLPRMLTLSRGLAPIQNHSIRVYKSTINNRLSIRAARKQHGSRAPGLRPRSRRSSALRETLTSGEVTARIFGTLPGLILKSIADGRHSLRKPGCGQCVSPAFAQSRFGRVPAQLRGSFSTL
jgi:hypothetical protein